MKPEILPFTSTLPSDWQGVLGSSTSPIRNLEAVLAWVELDLDGDLRFQKSLLLLVDQGLVWTDGQGFESWSMSDGAHLLHGDHAGVGSLKLESSDRLHRI